MIKKLLVLGILLRTSTLYIDPTTGGILLQLLFGGSAILFLLRRVIGGIFKPFSGRRSAAEDDEQP